MSVSRSLPEEWIVLANSTCRAVRLPSGFLQSWSDRISRLLSGVRSSCDMFARNSDLYFEVSASCSAFSSSAWRACSTSLVLALDLRVLLGEQPRLLLELLVGLLQLLLPALQLLRQRLRLLEQVLGARVGLDRVEHDADALGELVEERLVRRAEALERGELEHALDLALEQDRQHDDVLRRRLAQAGDDRACSPSGTLVSRIFSFSSAHWPTRPSPEVDAGVPMRSLSLGRRSSRAASRRGCLAARVEHVEHAVLRRHDRRELGEDQAADRRSGPSGPAACG